MENNTEKRGTYIQTKMSQQKRHKLAIAQHVVKEYVKDFDAVLLDAGSTAENIAKELFTQKKYLSVMTINMGAYYAYTQAIAPVKENGERMATMRGPGAGLLNENELLLPGGRYVPTYEALFGDRTLKTLETFTPNVTIIGVSGLRFNDGVFCHGAEEVQVKNLLWTMPTDTRVIAVDWTKLGKRDAHAFGKKVDELVAKVLKGVIVTTKPPRNASEEERKKFDDEVGKIKGSLIPTTILFIEPVPFSFYGINKLHDFFVVYL